MWKIMQTIAVMIAAIGINIFRFPFLD